MKENEKPNELLLNKYELLKEYLNSLKSVAIAFSSGVDSTFLLYVTLDILGYRTGSMNETLSDEEKRG